MNAHRPRVVIVGAGFGGLACARELADAPVDVTIVDRHNFHTFLPLLYQVATAGLNPADVAYPVRGIFQQQQNVSFRHAEVAGVDWRQRHVVFADGTDLAFDHLVIAAGSATNFFGVIGAGTMPSRSTRGGRELRNHVLECFESATQSAPHRRRCPDVRGGGRRPDRRRGGRPPATHQPVSAGLQRLAVAARVLLIEQEDRLLPPFHRSAVLPPDAGPRRGGAPGESVERIAARNHLALAGHPPHPHLGGELRRTAGHCPRRRTGSRRVSSSVPTWS
jgi:NADH dehydrogenase